MKTCFAEGYMNIKTICSNKQECTDKELVQRILSGDENCVACLLVDQCGKLIKFLERKYSMDGILGEVFLHLREDNWRRLATWKGESSLKSWLKTVIIRLCLKEIRKSGRWESLVNESAVKAKKFTEETMNINLDMKSLMRSVKSLKNKEMQAVLILCELQGYSAGEVARLLNIDEKKVYNLNYQAKLSLKKKYDHEKQ